MLSDHPIGAMIPATDLARAKAFYTDTLGGWLVPNLEAEIEDLKSRGVKFEDYDFPDFKTVNGIAEIEGFRGGWFKDTEGNVLAVVEQTKS